ncbi:MAG: MerR family transcriptional regulator [Alphaproteobacteria bacterium]|nr:MerR family transcriptional regulator [Alphaproteobacteria bacterium]
MAVPAGFLNPSDAAERLGVSAKALRLYEERGLIAPVRSAAGWRAYGPAEMARAADIVALRTLGFSLAQIARVRDGDPAGMERALADHQATLEARMRHLAGVVERIGRTRERLARGQTPTIGDLARLQAQPGESDVVVAFDLPWPWGGERFELRDVRPLNYIVGPLFSGKTRLARRLCETLPGAAFLDLDRTMPDGTSWIERLEADPALRARVDRALAWLVEDGAVPSDPMTALLAGLEAEGPRVLVVDMIEQGLDAPSQEALSAHLRRRATASRPLFMLTRSTAILELDAVGADEAIILCPANHSPPVRVAPYPGAAGYETVASCLATPEVRARTRGVIAARPAGG